MAIYPAFMTAKELAIKNMKVEVFLLEIDADSEGEKRGQKRGSRFISGCSDF